MLEKIILRLLKQKKLAKDKIDSLQRQFSPKFKLPFATTTELLKEYRRLLASKKIKPSLRLEKILQKRGIRTLSGVAVVTVLTKPWPCPGKCVYCPNEPGLPKSYLKKEPAAQRAHFNKFNPYKQVRSRLETLYHNGHPTDKIELIVKGGSWNAYPWRYRIWFIKECFRAANEVKTKNNNNKKTIKHPTDSKSLDYSIAKLSKEQTKNESADCRIIGLTLETRPDLITPTAIKQMRLLGCTRVELGAQHTDDKILKLIKRGHTLEETKRAVGLLRGAGFKIDFHLMPQLPGSTPQKDYAMFGQIFSNPGLRPDMIKIYPCVVMKNSPLYNWYKQKKYKPYSNKKLIELLIRIKSEIIPRFCRISRLIRDIPSTEITAGNRVTNLRETIQKEMEKRGLNCPCLRCREIGHQKKLKIQNSKFKITTQKLKLFVDKYKTSGGNEYFLSFEGARRNVVFAFCRLRICHSNPTLAGKAILAKSRKGSLRCPPSHNDLIAFIRELHTYGQLVSIGQSDKTASQHTGLGKKLIAEAEKIVRQNNAKKIFVISGVGARNYYRRLGYKLRNTYMTKRLLDANRLNLLYSQNQSTNQRGGRVSNQA